MAEDTNDDPNLYDEFDGVCLPWQEVIRVSHRRALES